MTGETRPVHKDLERRLRELMDVPDYVREFHVHVTPKGVSLEEVLLVEDLLVEPDAPKGGEDEPR